MSSDCFLPDIRPEGSMFVFGFGVHIAVVTVNYSLLVSLWRAGAAVPRGPWWSPLMGARGAVGEMPERGSGTLFARYRGSAARTTVPRSRPRGAVGSGPAAVESAAASVVALALLTYGFGLGFGVVCLVVCWPGFGWL